MQTATNITVLNKDSSCSRWLRSSARMKVVRRPNAQVAIDDAYIFVLVAASGLEEVADFVKEANRRHHLRALIVNADLDETWIGQMLDRADLRTLRNLLVHRAGQQPRRVLNAWRSGSQDDLIADALALPEALLVLTCALERIEVPWEQLRPLAGLSRDEREKFEVASDGSYIHWPAPDMHLDVEALRVIVDPRAKERARLERMRHAQNFGEAVAAVRKAAGLRQEDIDGVSARQLRRVECGEVFPRTATLGKMATAHGMSRAEYLDALARSQRAAVQ